MTIDRPADRQVPGLRRLWQQAFGDDDAFLDAFFGTAFAAERCRCVTVDGRVAAALYWLDCTCREQKLAYLYAVATDKVFRGKGLCHGLMADTHSHLASLGYAGAVLVPGSKELFRLYEGMGYRPFGGIREFTAAANAPAVVLRRIDAEEYAALRRQLLPAGGVVQEGPTLAFLQTQADFYAGEGFLLAAAMDGDHVFVPELLGAAPAAESIGAALGAKTGTFRTPAESPFAMYLPFCRAEPPAYFGLALD